MTKRVQSRPVWLRRMWVGSTCELWLGRWRHSKVFLKLLSDVDGQEAGFARRQNEVLLHQKLGEACTLAVLSDGEDVHPVEKTRRVHYLVLRYEEGVSLQQLVEHIEAARKYNDASAVSVTTPLLDTLGRFHACGLLHRDVHPRNFFAGTEGDVWAFDLGYVAPFDRGGRHVPASRAPRHSYEALDYAMGLQGDEGSDLYGVGVLGLQLLGVKPGILDDKGPGQPELVALFRDLIAAKAHFLASYAAQMDGTLKVGLRRVTPEPVDEAAAEPQHFLEVAACYDMLVYTFGFPADNITASLIAPSPEYEPAFGLVVKDLRHGTSFSIDLVANCHSVELFWERYTRWAVGFGKRFTEGQREALFLGTEIRRVEGQIVERMLAKGLVIPRLGLRGVLRSAAARAGRETSGH